MNLTLDEATGAPTTHATETDPRLDHERLDCFHVALEFAALVPTLTLTARPAMRDQLERAAASIALNLAEGCGRRGRDRRHFFTMAQGCWTSPLRGLVHLTGPSDLASAMECGAAIDILRVTGQVALPEATRAKHKLTGSCRCWSGCGGPKPYAIGSASRPRPPRQDPEHSADLARGGGEPSPAALGFRGRTAEYENVNEYARTWARS